MNARHQAIVRLTVRGPGAAELDVDTVIDSGVTASLPLPATTAAAPGLARQSGAGAVVADGSVRQFDVYAAEVEWNGNWRPVLVSAVGDLWQVPISCSDRNHGKIAVAHLRNSEGGL